MKNLRKDRNRYLLNFFQESSVRGSFSGEFRTWEPLLTKASDDANVPRRNRFLVLVSQGTKANQIHFLSKLVPNLTMWQGGTTRTPPSPVSQLHPGRETLMIGPLRSSLLRDLLALHVAVIIRLNMVQRGDHGQGRLSSRSRRETAALTE